MKYAKFKGDESMPLLGLGTWKSNDREAYHAVREAIKIGYRHFDCAARYENEAEIGEAFADAIAAGEVTRKELWITSKLWNNAHKPEHVMPALKETLRDLQVDYLDLYLMHWPVALRPEIIFPNAGDQFLPIEEAPLLDTWRALEACVDAGLVKHIGVSNFNIPKIQGILDQCRIAPECNQVELHPMLQQNDLVEFCLYHKIAVTAYSPLGSLDRPARLIKEGEPRLLENKVINEIATAHNCSPAQVLIAWAMTRGTAVIPKSSNPKRLKENFEATEVDLTPADMQAIAELDRNFRFIDGTIWTIPGSPYTLEWLWKG